MTVLDLKKKYEDSTEIVSELVRKLSLAGIAVIWTLRVTVSEKPQPVHYDRELLWPLGVLLVALVLDILQYIYQTIVFERLNAYHWKIEGDDDAKVEVSSWWNKFADVFFWGKTAFATTGICWLIRIVAKQLLTG